jgi:high-affinity Fe2+/Pb2+ permease
MSNDFLLKQLGLVAALLFWTFVIWLAMYNIIEAWKREQRRFGDTSPETSAASLHYSSDGFVTIDALPLRSFFFWSTLFVGLACLVAFGGSVMAIYEDADV